MKYTFFVTLILSIAALALTQPVFADTYGTGPYGTQCQPTYGSSTCPETPSISIDKKVQNPSTKDFVDNLSINDPKYGPNATVTFKIIVTNTGNTSLNNIRVTDVLPQYVTLASGDTDQTISLNAGEAKTLTITAKVVAENSLPSDQGVTCVTNVAKATQGDQTAQDNAQFCIQKNVLSTTVYPPVKVTQTPKTGPEAFGLLALLPTGAFGALLRRKSN